MELSKLGWIAMIAFINGFTQSIGSAVGNDIWVMLTKTSEVESPSFWYSPSFYIGIVSIIFGIILLLYDRIRWKDLVSKSDCPQGITRQLDPKLEHVWAVLFYPKTTSWHKKERTPYKWMPRYKAIINRNTKKAYPMLEYAQDILCRGKIQWRSETWRGEKAYMAWFEKNELDLEIHPANESDLLTGTRTTS